MSHKTLATISALLIVVVAHILSFSGSQSAPESTLSGARAQQCERLFSACINTDAEITFWKSKPRISGDDSSKLQNLFVLTNNRMASKAANSADAALKLSLQQSRTLWLIFCSLLI